MKRRDSTAASAFTLVELLVVIGLIAVLIGILLPVLGAARRQAQLTRCLATEREIAAAAAIHVSMHQGYYPIAGDLDGIPNLEVTGASPETISDEGRRKYMYTYVSEGSMNGLTVAPWHAAIATYMGNVPRSMADRTWRFPKRRSERGRTSNTFSVLRTKRQPPTRPSRSSMVAGISRG